MHLGGKGFNQAVAARRLGADVVVVGRVGDDEFGRMFLDALDREGIDRRAVAIDPTAGTGVASIIVEPDGTNTIVQAPRANRHVSVAAAAERRRATQRRRRCDDAARELGRERGRVRQRSAGCRSRHDAECRPGYQRRRRAAGRTDVLVVNEIEAAAVLGISASSRCRSRWPQTSSGAVPASSQ